MDKIEKIKAELERRISRCEKKHPPLMSDKDFTDEENEIYCEERAYREILIFIDSLQDEPKEETHTLLEWQQILAERPELMAEFERMCPPQQIQGSLLENKQNGE